MGDSFQQCFLFRSLKAKRPTNQLTVQNSQFLQWSGRCSRQT
ncbi:rCG52984 [Rattus norvegicus]|uniref:RCG52984 n=1 Tax=Rattus norvegicus TaxID=10116 RepID=A6IRR0_RAT|nr:rCG52984 [Rattus norvegicus]